MTHVIQPGESIPAVPVKLVDADGIVDTSSDQVLGQGRVVLFAVPGAFTPTCHVNHLPSFLANADKLKAAGIDRIVCAATNDHHVMKAWATASDALGVIDFVADGNGQLAKALGLDKDMSGSGMGLRYARSAMLIRDGRVEAVFAEDKPGQVTATGAPAILLALQGASA
ncbi:MAG TPA: peroxiredoxin [Devosiaceae bacterium]|jgi:peroxiredoxin|nr:peroxiredoxin [Devosiaceae bacterium]